MNDELLYKWNIEEKEESFVLYSTNIWMWVGEDNDLEEVCPGPIDILQQL